MFIKIIQSLFILIVIYIDTSFEIQLELRSHLVNDSVTQLRNLKVKELSSAFNKSYAMTMNMCIGKPPQCFDLVYDIANHFTWVVDCETVYHVNNYFKPFNSKTCYVDNKYHSVYELSGREFQDFIQFTSVEDEIFNKTQLPFNMFLISEQTNLPIMKYDGILGLNRLYQATSFRVEKNQNINGNPKYSFINYLYLNNIINKRIFAHTIRPNGKGILYLGETGTSEVNYPTCDSHSPESYSGSFYSNYWHCPLSNVYDNTHNNHILKFYDEMIGVFDSNYEHIVIPREYWKELFRYILKNKNANCNNEKIEDYGSYKQCEFDDLSNLPDISFEISSKVNITFHPNEIWKADTIKREGNFIKIYNSIIISNRFLSHSLVFGTIALEKYHMIFNYDNDTIGFISKNYSSMNIDYIMTPKQIIKLTMFYFQIILLIMISFALIVIYYQRELIFSIKAKSAYIQSEMGRTL